MNFASEHIQRVLLRLQIVRDMLNQHRMVNAILDDSDQFKDEERNEYGLPLSVANPPVELPFSEAFQKQFDQDRARWMQMWKMSAASYETMRGQGDALRSNEASA